jgi:hypothetical protein
VFLVKIVSLVNTLVDISIFIMSGGILFKVLILGINEMVLLCLSSEVLKGYYLFLFTRPIFLLNYWNFFLFNVNVFVFFIIYFCFVFGFFCSSCRHLLVTLLRLEFIVLVLYFYFYFYLCSLIIVCSLLFIFSC